MNSSITKTKSHALRLQFLLSLVYLHGISVDNFYGEAGSKVYGQFRLACSSGTHYHHDLGLWVRIVDRIRIRTPITACWLLFSFHRCSLTTLSAASALTLTEPPARLRLNSEGRLNGPTEACLGLRIYISLYLAQLRFSFSFHFHIFNSNIPYSKYLKYLYN